MPRLIGEHHDANGIRERWFDQGDGNVTVERHQDAQAAVDLVSAVNSEGAKTIDGLGKPVGDLPYVVWIDWCSQRGLDWEKLFQGNELDAEYRRCLAENNKLQYKAAKTVHAL